VSPLVCVSGSIVSARSNSWLTSSRAVAASLLDAGPYTFVAADALVLKVREQGRVVNVHALIAVGVNAEGYREILGIDVTTAEDGAGWLTFLRSLPEGCPESSWSPPMPTPGCWPRPGPPCRERPGSGAEPITRPT
jgi:putative transposase